MATREYYNRAISCSSPWPRYGAISSGVAHRIGRAL